MTSSFSPNRGYNLQGTGDNSGSWGVVLNNQVFSIIDLNLGGTLALNVAGSSNITLSAGQQQNAYILMTGLLTGDIQVIFTASAGGFFFIDNRSTGAHTITAIPAGGTGVVVPQNALSLVFIDGNNNRAVAAAPAVSPSSGGILGVSLGGTGQTSVLAAFNALSPLTTQGDVLYFDGSNNTRLGPGTSGQVLTTQGAGQNPIWSGGSFPSATASFLATKSGLQTGIASNTPTIVTFDTAVSNIGSHYNAGGSYWQPPAGRCIISAGVSMIGNFVTNQGVVLYIWKNSAAYKELINYGTTGVVGQAASLSLVDVCNGTDAYQIVVQMTLSSGTGDVQPSPASWFSGSMI